MLALCEGCLAESPFDRPADAAIVAQMFERDRPARRSASTRYRLKPTAIGLSLVLGAGLVALRKPRRPDSDSVTGRTTLDVRRLSAVGEPADWTQRASLVADIPGLVHCFSLVQKKIARLVWGTPRRVEDLDLATGRRRPAEWLPDELSIRLTRNLP